MEQKIEIYVDSEEAYNQVVAALNGCELSGTEIFWDIPVGSDEEG